MKNYVQAGNRLTLTAPYDVASGGGALVGLIFAIAVAAVANGAQGEFDATPGAVYDITALSTDTAAGAGVAAYWDNTNKRITTTSSGNTKVGVFVAAKVNGDLTARIRLNGTF